MTEEMILKRIEELKSLYYDNYDSTYYKFNDLANDYIIKVEPYLSVINDYLIRNPKFPMKSIAHLLYVGYAKFKAMKKVFEPLKEAIESKQSVMQLKSQLDLAKGLSLKPSSAKLIEIQMTRFDDEYKKKDTDAPKETPTLRFEVVNAKISDAERESKAPKIE